MSVAMISDVDVMGETSHSETLRGDRLPSEPDEPSPDDPSLIDSPDDPSSLLLASLVRGPRAWSAAADLPGDPEPLVALGWLEPWNLPNGGRVYTLSPWGAERLGVEIVERGPAEEPMWSRIGIPPHPIQLARRYREVAFVDGEEFQAPRQGILQELMMDSADEDRPVRLFARGPDGEAREGHVVLIDPRLAKGRGKASVSASASASAPTPVGSKPKGRKGKATAAGRSKTSAKGKGRPKDGMKPGPSPRRHTFDLAGLRDRQ